jgi:hypothetical protein
VRLEHRASTRRHEQLVGDHGGATLDRERPGRAVVPRAFDPDTGPHRDAVGIESGKDRRGGLLVLLWQDVGEGFQGGDLCAEPCVDLSELDPHRARPDHGE